MKTLTTLFLFLTILLCSCENLPAKNVVNLNGVELGSESDMKVELEDEKNKHFKNMDTDSLWNYLLFTKGGCLDGGQHVEDRVFGGEGCEMSNSKEWEIFFYRDQKQLTTFLISKISGDKTETKIHTCPFFSATEGEVAVYALQKIFSLNWYGFDDFKEYKDQETEGALENHQAWIQKILKNKAKRRILINCWTKKASEL